MHPEIQFAVKHAEIWNQPCVMIVWNFSLYDAGFREVYLKLEYAKIRVQHVTFLFYYFTSLFYYILIFCVIIFYFFKLLFFFMLLFYFFIVIFLLFCVRFGKADYLPLEYFLQPSYDSAVAAGSRAFIHGSVHLLPNSPAKSFILLLLLVPAGIFHHNLTKMSSMGTHRFCMVSPWSSLQGRYLWLTPCETSGGGWWGVTISNERLQLRFQNGEK